jgi:glycosyltransferase involved in cell wall biosynthesis
MMDIQHVGSIGASRLKNGQAVQGARQNRPRVLLVLPNLQIGGSQEAVRTLAKYLPSQNCLPVVCALFDGGPLVSDLKLQGTQVEVLSLPRHRFFALPWFITDMARIWRELARVITAYEIDVVQTYILGFQHFLVLALARRIGVSLTILNFRNEKFLPDRHPRSLRNRIHRLAYRVTRRQVGGFVAVSAETKQAMVRLLGLSEEDVTVILNGVDLERYRQPVDHALVRRELGLEPDASLIVTVATLKPQKGHRYLIEAAANLVRRYPKVCYLLVGDGELRAELEAQVKAFGLSERILFLGSRRDVARILTVSDLFVLPSLWEGFSMALLEAMAAGKPVVVTRVSGTSQVIVDGETGVMVSPGDSNALEHAIAALLSNPARAQALGEAAYRHVEGHFGMKIKAAEYAALYHRLLDERAQQCLG